MTLVKNNRFNLIMGSVLTILVTLPTFVIGDAKDSSFLPHNAWLWPSLLILLICGLLFSLFSLMNKVHLGVAVVTIDTVIEANVALVQGLQNPFRAIVGSCALK